MQQALRLANPEQSGYIARWPIYGSNFNTRDYPSLQVILSDLEALLQKTLKDRLDINAQDYKVGNFFFPDDLHYHNRAELFCRARYTRFL